MHQRTPPVGLSSKDESIETLRGIAALMLVAFHSAIKTPDGETVFDYVSYSLRFVRMPLFTVISGFVYAIRPVQSGQAGAFLRGKARRILLPFVSVATVHFLMKALLPGVSEPERLADIWLIYPFGFDVYWFLQGIFLVFLLVTALDLLSAMDRPSRWFLCFLGAVLLTLYCPRSEVFSFFGFLYLLPFFLLGVGLNRFDALLRDRRIVFPVAAIGIVGLTIQQLAWFGDLDIGVGKIGILSIVVGTSTILVFFRLRRRIGLLARLGIYAYSIYLFHFLGLAAGPRLARIFPALGETVPLFVTKVVFCLAVPIVIEIVLRRSRIFRRIFLGLR